MEASLIAEIVTCFMQMMILVLRHCSGETWIKAKTDEYIPPDLIVRAILYPRSMDQMTVLPNLCCTNLARRSPHLWNDNDSSVLRYLNENRGVLRTTDVDILEGIYKRLHESLEIESFRDDQWQMHCVFEICMLKIPALGFGVPRRRGISS
jgi:hypothetical protein